MSKSDYNQKSCLYVLDDADTMRSKIKGAVTDFTGEVTFDPENRPGVSNLVCIHSRITGQDPQTICDEVSGLNTGQYKVLLSDIVIDHFKPMSPSRQWLVKHCMIVKIVPQQIKTSTNWLKTLQSHQVGQNGRTNFAA